MMGFRKPPWMASASFHDVDLVSWVEETALFAMLWLFVVCAIWAIAA